MRNITVFLVDGTTRLHLPSSQWGQGVIEKLQLKGHTVQRTNDVDFPDNRTPDELARRDALLEETGM